MWVTRWWAPSVPPMWVRRLVREQAGKDSRGCSRVNRLLRFRLRRPRCDCHTFQQNKTNVTIGACVSNTAQKKLVKHQKVLEWH
jgi:hypothetical protein